MNLADWCIVGVVLFSVVVATLKGFFFEVISLAGTVIGYLVASWQYPRAAAWIQPHVNSEWVANILGFLLIFVAIVAIAGLIAKLARWAMNKAGLTWFDRVLGGLFGLLKGSLIVAILLLMMTAFTPTSEYLSGSQLAPYFLVVGRAAIWVAPAGLRAQFYQGLDMLQDVRR